MSVVFPAPLSPDICVVDDAGEDVQQLLVFALTADGVLHRIRLPQPEAPEGRNGHVSVLADLSFEDVSSVDVNAELRRLDRCVSKMERRRQLSGAGRCAHITHAAWLRCAAAVLQDGLLAALSGNHLRSPVFAQESPKLNFRTAAACRPTCMAAIDGTVCIGGSNGRVAVIDGEPPLFSHFVRASLPPVSDTSSRDSEGSFHQAKHPCVSFPRVFVHSRSSKLGAAPPTACSSLCPL